MTPMLTAIRFESAYLLCHVNAIDAHVMRIQFNSLRMRIETGLQWASCEHALSGVSRGLILVLYDNWNKNAKDKLVTKQGMQHAVRTSIGWHVVLQVQVYNYTVC